MSTAEAQSYISLLKDTDVSVQYLALENILKVIDHAWPVVSQELITLENLYEDEYLERHPDHQYISAYIISKIYYYLGNFDQAIKYALGSSKYFDPSIIQSDLFVETIVTKSLEKYLALSKSITESKHMSNDEKTLFHQLKKIFYIIFERSLESEEFMIALGITVESNDVDGVKRVFNAATAKKPSSYIQKLIAYASSCVGVSFSDKRLRAPFYEFLFSKALELNVPDYNNAEKLAFLARDSKLFVALFQKLADDLPYIQEAEGLDYQYAFDVEATNNYSLISEVANEIPNIFAEEKASDLINILEGNASVHLKRHALNKNRSIDLAILKKAKSHLDGKFSVFHNAVALANSFVHCGTGDDKFVRDNLNWLGKAKHWAKFSATASLGVLHRYDVDNAEKLLQPYLPSTKNPSRFIKAGSLYGLAIIFAGNAGKDRVCRKLFDILDENIDSIEEDATQILLHGTCLGLGITSMGTDDSEVKGLLTQASHGEVAACSDAALYALGLNSLGKADDESLQTAFKIGETSKHNNIIQAAGLSIALNMFEQGQNADAKIDELVTSNNSFFRYGAPYTIGMAYVGTGNSRAIEMLLDLAVTDPDDNIRRAAATNLGFVLCKDHAQVPRLVGSLSRSHDPFVRCGSAMALGISSAGKNYMPAVDVLMTLTKDPTDFVKQHAFIALAMVLIQQTEKSNPVVKEVNELFDSVISTRRVETLTKFGACLGQGIMNACGRNGTIQLENTEFGTINPLPVVGVMMFTQFWNWFPLAHFLNLAFTPSNVMAVAAPGFSAPDVSFQCHTVEGVFDYPEITKEEVSKKPSKGKTAVLSTSKLGKTKTKIKQLIQKREDLKAELKEEQKLQKEKEAKAEQERDKKVHQNKNIFSQQPYKLENFSRILANQSKYVSFGKNDRYAPVRKYKGTPGIVVLKDLQPSSAESKSCVFDVPFTLEAPRAAFRINENIGSDRFDALQEELGQQYEG